MLARFLCETWSLTTPIIAQRHHKCRGRDCIHPFQGRFPRAQPSLTRLAFHAARTHTPNPGVPRVASSTREKVRSLAAALRSLANRRVPRSRFRNDNANPLRAALDASGSSGSSRVVAVLFHRHPLELPSLRYTGPRASAMGWAKGAAEWKPLYAKNQWERNFKYLN